MAVIATKRMHVVWRRLGLCCLGGCPGARLSSPHREFLRRRSRHDDKRDNRDRVVAFKYREDKLRYTDKTDNSTIVTDCRAIRYMI